MPPENRGLSVIDRERAQNPGHGRVVEPGELLAGYFCFLPAEDIGTKGCWNLRGRRKKRRPIRSCRTTL
jgi:hypothetical protein